MRALLRRLEPVVTDRSIPGQTMGVSVFADPLIEATGMSRFALSNA